MANEAFPITDDEEISWADISVVLSLYQSVTIDIADVEGIKCGGKIETGFSFGTSGGRVMKETRGKASHEGSGTFSMSAVDRIESALAVHCASKGYVRGGVALIAVPKFSIVIQHKTLSQPNNVYQTEMLGCRWRSFSMDNKEGSEALFIEVDLGPTSVIKTLKNGTRVALL
jgi:hypothetical protein